VRSLCWHLEHAKAPRSRRNALPLDLAFFTHCTLLESCVPSAIETRDSSSPHCLDCLMTFDLNSSVKAPAPTVSRVSRDRPRHVAWPWAGAVSLPVASGSYHMDILGAGSLVGSGRCVDA
jgi:hypothetical protein